MKTLEHRIAALESVLGSDSPVQDARDAIEYYIMERRLQGVADTTINAELKVLRAAFRHSHLKPEYRDFKLLRESKGVPTVLTKDEVHRLLAHADEPYKTMLRLAWRTGLRQGELRHLEKTDIRPEGVWVHPKPFADWKPKNHHERVVPLTPDALHAAAEHMNTPGIWLFPSPEDQNRPRFQVDLGVRRIFKNAGLYQPERKPGLHMLRRTWATELLAAGADIETVRQLGGWSSLEVVQRYVTSTDARKREAIGRLVTSDA